MSEPKTLVDVTVEFMISRKEVRTLCTMEPSMTMREAKRRMDSHGVNSAFVTALDGRPIGVVTNSDFMTHAELEGLLDTPVGDLMSTPVITVTRENTLSECQRLMNENDIRHLGVVTREDGPLEQVISIGDTSNMGLQELTQALLFAESYAWGP